MNQHFVSVDTQKGHSERTLRKDTWKGHSERTLGKDTRKGHSKRTLRKDTQKGHSERTLGKDNGFTPTEISCGGPGEAANLKRPHEGLN